MTWWLLFALAGIVFCNRYLLLEPKLPLTLPILLQRALHFSAPCLLSAVAAPIVLNHTRLAEGGNQPYLWGTVCCIAIASISKNTLLVIIGSLFIFYIFIYFS